MQGYVKQSFWMHFLPSCLSSLLLLLLVSILMEKYYKVCVARAAVNVYHIALIGSLVLKLL